MQFMSNAAERPSFRHPDAKVKGPHVARDQMTKNDPSAEATALVSLSPDSLRPSPKPPSMAQDSSSTAAVQRKVLPGRNTRTIASVRHSHLLGVDGLETPTYDASEEDNDELIDDAASAVSIPAPHSRAVPSSPLAARITRRQAHKIQALESDTDTGVDSPTYDGDIESSTTAAPPSLPSGRSVPSPPSASSSAPTPPKLTPRMGGVDLPPAIVLDETDRTPGSVAVDTAALTEEDIQAFVKLAIDGGAERAYKINPAPKGRPIRIYADGVYDIFHYGHALQLRQAKLAFPSVHLLVGVCSDVLVQQHKSPTVMTHVERCESVRGCRWVDEVVEDAPWVIDSAFIEKHKIDYVAHDEEPYKSVDSDDVYSLPKSLGKFIPTRRTAGISTSELLERIVSQYRKGRFDRKLEKIGHAELIAEGSDYDDNRPFRSRERTNA